MPVSTESSISGPYTPNGATTDFAFDFKATDKDEVVAVDQDGTTIPTALYSVTLDEDEGGTLSFSSAPTLAQYSSIFIVGEPALTQPSDFDNAGPSFNPAALTRALDRAAARDLKQQRVIDRAIAVPFGENGLTLPVQASRSGLYLGFNASGDAVAIEGTGDDGTVRPDLASTDAAKGAALVATPLGGSVADDVTARLGARSFANAGKAAAFDNGSIVEIAGLKYERDDTATDADSATNDLSVDGLKPYGEAWTPEHFGTTSNISIDGTGRKVKGKGVAQSLISNTANSPVFSIVGAGTGAGSRYDQVQISDLKITHDGSLTAPAIKMENASFGLMQNVYLQGANGAEEGITIGHSSGSALTLQSYSWLLMNVIADDFNTHGLRFQSAGSGLMMLNCHLRRNPTVIASANACILGGQYDAIDINNPQGGQDYQFYVAHQSFETIGAGEFGIRVTGTTSQFSKGFLHNIMTNGAVMAGTLVDLTNARQVEATLRAKNATSMAGNIINFGAGARECVAYMDADTATAPFTANASGLRNTKVVTGQVARASTSAITTSTNARTVLAHGVDNLPPNFIPAHNGVAWNFQILSLADDTATSFTPPRQRGMLKVMTGGDATCIGIIAYNADATTPTCTLLAGGGTIEVTTGALTGSTGTNNFLQVSTHTDGKIYVANRKGSANSRITVLMDSVEWF